MKAQEKLNQKGMQTINGLRLTVHDLWGKLCEEANILPEDSMFAVFSDDNKYLPFYNKALDMLWAVEREYRAGGYVGLKIVNGKAS